MIPTTIAKLAKRHKRLKKDLVEKFALSYDQMETMDAVDLVLDGLSKLGKKQNSTDFLCDRIDRAFTDVELDGTFEAFRKHGIKDEQWSDIVTGIQADLIAWSDNVLKDLRDMKEARE